MELFFTGKTVEAATESALQQLGIDREEISIEVVEMPVKRLFRSIPAKIRVTLLAEEEENARKAEKEAAAKREEKPAPQPAKKKQEKPAKAEKPAAPKEEKKPQPAVEPAVKATATAAAETVEAAPAKEPKVISPEKIELARTFLQTVAADMGVTDFTVTPQQQEETLVLKVEGENLGILIGRRGETMESLSYLTGLVTNRIGGDYQKVALDVAGYRSKRESDLVALAKRAGARVQKTGRSYTMEPMNPYERRIIHSTIGKMEGVTSESTGEGEDRRVVISSTGPNAVTTPEKPRNSKGGKGRGGRGGRNGGSRDGGRGGRGGNRGGRGNGGQHREAARTEYKERSREQTAAPVAGERTEVVNDAPNVSLYGKIEL